MQSEKNGTYLKNEREILAFAHIGKTGGTTLIHILRHNYFARCIDVVPFSKVDDKIFRADDMRKILRINPFTECIMGHSVKPHSDLTETFPNVKYITLLRDPIHRCISQYQQRVRKYGFVNFEEFLTREWLRNLQTRFIAGREDITQAKAILSERISLVGLLENFDEFLVLLSKKVLPKTFNPAYKIKRESKNKDAKNRLLRKHLEQIKELHQLDLELYKYAKEELIPEYKKSYGDSFERDVQNFKQANQAINRTNGKHYADYLLRKLYYEPAKAFVRLLPMA